MLSRCVYCYHFLQSQRVHKRNYLLYFSVAQHLVIIHNVELFDEIQIGFSTFSDLFMLLFVARFNTRLQYATLCGSNMGYQPQSSVTTFPTKIPFPLS